MDYFVGYTLLIAAGLAVGLVTLMVWLGLSMWR